MGMGDPVDPMYGGYDQSVLMDLQRTQMQLSQTMAQYQLNFEKEIERLDHLLRGVAKSAKDGTLVKMREPMVNDAGHTHIMTKCRMTLNKVIIQSNYDLEIVNKWCLLFWAELTDDIAIYGDYWDLKDYEYDNLKNNVVFIIHGIMLAALNGGFRDILGKISKVSEVVNNTLTNQRGRGLLP